VELPEQLRQVSPDSGSDYAERSEKLPVAEGEGDAMYKERAEKAEAEVKQLQGDILDLRKRLNEYREIGNFPPNGGGDLTVLPASKVLRQDSADPRTDWSWDAMYDYIKQRAMNDPGILQLLATKPELRITVEQKTLEADGDSLRGGIALLLQRGFFSAPKNGNAVFKELQRIGRKVATRTVYDELERIAEWGFLTKESEGYQATDLKVTVRK